MKTNIFMLLAALLSTHQALACLGSGELKICPGDIVYNGGSYSLGAIVLGVNYRDNSVTVRAINGGTVWKDYADSLYITSGCIDGVCVGDTVYRGGTYSHGAVVLAINFYERSVTLRTPVGSVYSDDPRSLDVVNACLDYDDLARKNSMR